MPQKTDHNKTVLPEVNGSLWVCAPVKFPPKTSSNSRSF